MIKKSRAVALPVLVLAAFALVLTACGSGGGDDSPTGGSGGGDDSPTVGSGDLSGEYNPRAYEGTTLRVLRHSGYDADVMQEAFAGFTEATGIEVKMDLVPYGELRTKEVVELSSSSSTYDLMSASDYWLAQYSGAGWLQPLDDYLDSTAITDPEFDVEDIDPRLLDANVVDGQLYAVPWKFNAPVMAYRTDIFDAAPATYEEWLAGRDAAEAAGMSLVGLSLAAANGPTFFLDLVRSNGGEFLNEDNTAAAFNTPEGAEALEFLVELSQSSADGAVNRAWDESAQLMARGDTASDIFVSSVTNTAQSGEAEGRVAFAPVVPAATSSVFVDTWGLLIPAGSENPEAAYMLMQYLTSKDVVRGMAEGGEGSVVPVRESLLTDSALTELYPAFDTLREAAGTGTFWPQIETLDATRRAVAGPIQSAVLGELTVAEALDAAEQAVNETLNP